MRSVGGLVFLGRVPGTRVVDDMIGGRDIKADTAHLMSEDNGVEPRLFGEEVYDPLAITIQLAVDDVGPDFEGFANCVLKWLWKILPPV